MASRQTAFVPVWASIWAGRSGVGVNPRRLAVASGWAHKEGGAITYGASGLWFYQEREPSGAPSSLLLTTFAATNQAYLMGFLFLLAGYFTPASLERKGYGRFLGDRFLRLGLPCWHSA